MASKELLDMINKAISMEMQVAIQYMWQHVMWSGHKGFAVKDELRKIAIDEMKHAEAMAERLFYLGATPTTEPAPIKIGSSLKEMLEIDAKDELDAINFYKKIIEKAREENDIVTARLFEDILADEEEHHDTFTGILEDL